MSGVAGLIMMDGSDHDRVTKAGRMLAAMGHRAPDGNSSWCDRHALLCHGWHNTTGSPDFAVQSTSDRSCVITGDMRLDDRAELIARLDLDAKLSDAHIVLHAYRRWGMECVTHLIGDFAFALWDSAEQALFCARDHLGVRPFHYVEANGQFIFASDLRPLVSAGIRTTSIDDDYVSTFLVGLPADEEKTAIGGIKRLPPGSLLWLDRRGLRVSRYWVPQVGQAAPKADREERFRELFLTAVRDRLRGPARIGGFLSGGLDSSSICTAAAEIRPHGRAPLQTFSAVFPGQPELDERTFIEAVLKKGGLEPSFVEVSPADAFNQFAELIEQQEGLFVAPGIAVTRKLFTAAAASGVGVVLDGHGGDEVVSHGDRRVYELASQRHWWPLWKELRGISAIHGTPLLSSYLRLVDHYGASGKLARMLRLVRMHPTADSSVAWRNLVRPDFANRTALGDRFRTRMTLPTGARTDDREFHLWRVSSPLVSHAFETLNKLAAASGVEARFPFWDRRLVEFCLALPSEEKLSQGWSRHILRRAMEGILPREVQWRPGKIDFTPNLVRGLLQARPSIEQLLRQDSGLESFVDIVNVRGVLDQMARTPRNVRGDEAQFVWRAVLLGHWLRAVTNRQTGPAPFAHVNECVSHGP